jgi:hypothetical protein
VISGRHGVPRGLRIEEKYREALSMKGGGRVKIEEDR